MLFVVVMIVGLVLVWFLWLVGTVTSVGGVVKLVLYVGDGEGC